MRTIACLIALALPVLSQDKTDEWSRLIEQLSSDELDAREASVAKLIAAGRPALPALRHAASKAEADLKARLDHVIKSITEPRWLTDVAQALERAKTQKKPLLVFSTTGALDGYV